MIFKHLFLGLTGLWIVGTAGVVTSFFTPQRVIADVTNDFGVCVLQLLSSKEENVAFSPYGLISVAVVLYEASTGPSASEIHNTLKLPWDREVTRAGFRDLHRYLKSYFSNDGFLRGLVLSKPNISLRTNYTDLLHFYGYDIRTSHRTPSGDPSIFTTAPPKTTLSMDESTKTLTTMNQIKPMTARPTATEPQPTTLGTTTKKTPLTTTKGTTRLTAATFQVTTNLPTQPATQTTQGSPQTRKLTSSPSPITTSSPLSTLPMTTQTSTAPRTQLTEAFTSTQTPSRGVMEKSTESAQSAETLDVITLTQKLPSMPEIMSQVNGSVETSTLNVESRGGAVDIEMTTKPNLQVFQSTTNIPVTESLPTSQPQATLWANDTIELSVAEITVTKSESTDNPNYTALLLTGSSGTDPTTILPQTLASNSGVTLFIETTTDSPNMNTEMQFGTVNSATVLPSKSTTASDGTTLNSGKENDIVEQTVEQELPTTVGSMFTTVDQNSQSTMGDFRTGEPQFLPESTILEGAPSATEPAELMIGAASEAKLHSITKIAREQRSLYSAYKTQEQQQSGSNWVPQYYDQRWGYNPTNEFWFFTYSGGNMVPAHTYTAYLPFAFVPDLSSLALQLPLDDPRYSILIVLPEERYGLSQLLYALQWCPVRAILSHLKMTAVYAILPAFTIVKHVNLVQHLMKLGIRSIFDPFRADLSPMTSEPHVFVKNIEQVVTVSLRKYFMINRQFEPSPSEIRQHFVANHPFVYFVIDKETDVTLMAGTIVNPAHNLRP